METKDLTKLFIILISLSLVGCFKGEDSSSAVETEMKGDTVLVKLYHDNGYPKYIGSVYKGSKFGVHREYDELDSGLLVSEMRFDDDILNSIQYYNEEGIKTYNSVLVNKKVDVKANDNEVIAEDTLEVFLKFAESNYEFLSFIPGDFTTSVDFVSGANAIQSDGFMVQLKYTSSEGGKDTLRGYLLENTYEMFNDSMAAHVGAHTYFEYPIIIKPKEKI